MFSGLQEACLFLFLVLWNQTFWEWQSSVEFYLSMPLKYLWWELPQVPFLSWQKFVATNMGLAQQNKSFVVTKHVFCCDRSMRALTTFLVANIILSWQLFCLSWKTTSTWEKYVYCDKSFVTTSILLSRQTRVCCNKTFVTTKIYLWQLPPVILKRMVTAASVRFCCTVVADLFENHCEVTLGGWQDIKIQMLTT